MVVVGGEGHHNMATACNSSKPCSMDIEVQHIVFSLQKLTSYSLGHHHTSTDRVELPTTLPTMFCSMNNESAFTGLAGNKINMQKNININCGVNGAHTIDIASGSTHNA